jgi:hypothetical protein
MSTVIIWDIQVRTKGGQILNKTVVTSYNPKVEKIDVAMERIKLSLRKTESLYLILSKREKRPDEKFRTFQKVGAKFRTPSV